MKETSLDFYDDEEDEEIVASRNIKGAPEATQTKPIPMKNKAMVKI